MVEFFADLLAEYYGPFRLLKSNFYLGVIGTMSSFFLTFFALPKLWEHFTTDKGRPYAIGAESSIGKPSGVGVILIGSILLTTILFCPINVKILSILPLIGAASLVGYIDDASDGLSELTLGLSDLLISIAASILIFGFSVTSIWLPFTTSVIEISPLYNLPLSTIIIWISINALNCNDGVDGLSGSLSLVSIISIAALLYTITGHINQAEYLLIPYNSDAVSWAVFCTIVCGSICGYLWYNFSPSQVLMGDAGSRPVGLIIGILVCISQNPFLIFVFALLILLNGATGLLKVILIRLFNLRILSSIRFPLHDHARKNLNWSDSQVLGRFLLLHIGLIIILFSIMLKIR